MWKIATVQYEVRFTVWFMLWKIAAAQYEDGFRLGSGSGATGKAPKGAF